MKRFSTIYVPGCWDLLHHGHLNILRQAREMAETVIVGVVSDLGVAEYKDKIPVLCEKTRLAVVRALRDVDCAVLQMTTDPSTVVEALRPDALLHGDDWERLKIGQPTLEQLGIEFVRVPYTPGISTTALREKMVA